MKGPGDLVGRYRIETLLGEGGIANVYRVRHELLGTVHALKLLPRGKESLARRLLQEGRIQAHLQHPNVVAVTDVIEQEDLVGLLMEFIQGFSLEECLRDGGAMEQAETMDLFGQILSGVAAAHQAGVLHRDLKPANVLLTALEGQVVAKVADFGIAKLVTKEDALRKTMVGTPLGTPGYMAPEQISDSAQADARSDIFALGAILYEMLTGRRTFGGRDLLKILNNTAEGRFIPLRKRLPQVPQRVERAVNKALEVNPQRRFQSCMEMASALGIEASITELRQLSSIDDGADLMEISPDDLQPDRGGYAYDDSGEVEAEELGPDSLEELPPDPRIGSPSPPPINRLQRRLPPLPELESEPSHPTLAPALDSHQGVPVDPGPESDPGFLIGPGFDSDHGFDAQPDFAFGHEVVSDQDSDAMFSTDDPISGTTWNTPSEATSATLQDGLRPWGRSDAIDTWAPDDTDEHFELPDAEAIPAAAPARPPRAHRQDFKVPAMRARGRERSAPHDARTLPMAVAPDITKDIANSLVNLPAPLLGGHAAQTHELPRGMQRGRSKGNEGGPDRVVQVTRFLTMAVAPVAAVALLAVVLGLVGTARVDQTQSEVQKLRAQLDEGLAWQEDMVAQALALGVPTERLNQRLETQATTASDAERLKAAHDLTEFLMVDLSKLPSSSNQEQVKHRRALELKLRELRERQRAHAAGVKDWQSASRDVAGAMAVRLGFAEGPPRDD